MKIIGGVMSDGKEVTSDSPFLIGSLSKPITSIAVMMLVDEGRVKLGDPIHNYLPSFVYKTTNGKEITVQHLLEQTSGISQMDGLKATDLNRTLQMDISETAKLLSGVELSNEPGKVYEYNSANYLLLGAIIEQAAGQPYSDYIDKHVFEPLDMKNSAGDYDLAIEKGFVPGFESWFGKPVKSDGLYDQSGTPYGYIISSTNDLAKFLAFIQEGGEGISPESLELIRTPPKDGRTYGLGWHFSKVDSFPFHGGATPDYRGEMFYIPEQNYSAVLLTNKYHILEDEQVFNIMAGIRSIMDGEEPAQLPKPSSLVQWITLSMAFLFALLTVIHIVKLRRKSNRSKWPFVYGTLLLVLSIFLIPILSYLLNSPWRTITLFAPDIALSILILVCLAAINGLALVFVRFF